MVAYVKTGLIVGTGSAVNVELGFLPDHVSVFNGTDGDLITQYFSKHTIAFTSGGTTEIEAGQTITGATSGATAKIHEVLLDTGSWAGGDAAGWFVCKEADITGTFQSENVDVGSSTNLATVSAQAGACAAISTAVASATGNAAITAYQGTSGATSKGFTIGSTVSEDARLLRFIALADSV